MAAFIPALHRLIHAARTRRQVAMLSELDDHLLEDIGLRRTDVRTALAQPLYRNPSRMLRELCCQGNNLFKRLQDAIAPEPVACC
ncbi:DUF1127 domain-containing protein [Microvirga sp. CF3062]|uniref:DUF1127 domain-containing protein n=1 Tax=Microvirga sp. CF3062 TaxID=3110182 RepID=UPI002E789860|nr:DUF1127 domain-containing protein [Microvirga sp. CF3062]MEE1654948.1 DUF1127 domain-containing protein [Microvirga sp. CF3062]